MPQRPIPLSRQVPRHCYLGRTCHFRLPHSSIRFAHSKRGLGTISPNRINGILPVPELLESQESDA